LNRITAEYKRSYSKGGGIIFMISDLLNTENLKEALANLPSPTYQLAILHLLHPQELNPSLQGQLILSDCETAGINNYDLDSTVLRAYRHNLDAWIETLNQTCLLSHALYTMIPTDWALDNQVIPHLRSMRFLTPI
jgi:hypothetical protein